MSASSSKYERVPNTDAPASSSRAPWDEEKRRLYMTELRQQEQALARDPRFEREAPSLWKRIALLAFVMLLFWMAARMRLSAIPRTPEAKVSYADRYNKEYKYRPAASPILTRTMDDGRVRIHGAQPTHVRMQQYPQAPQQG